MFSVRITGAVCALVMSPKRLQPKQATIRWTQLPAGSYDLSVEAPGFKKTSQAGIRVQVAQTARVDIRLAVGSTAESVIVTTDAPLLRTENAEQSINVTGNRINNLPLNFGGGGGATGGIRNWISFIQLAPGVSGNNERASINGSPGGAFKVIVEGQDLTSSNDTIWTSTVSAASVEMISEFSFQGSNFAAEFGQTLGGVFNFTTKSGTNQFHGSLFEYPTNEALDARRPFAGLPLSRKHDFGGTIGGPVWIPRSTTVATRRSALITNVSAYKHAQQALSIPCRPKRIATVISVRL